MYDLTKFSALHPGGVAVLLNNNVAGQDATNAFYALHRQDILQRPQYARLQVGTLEGEEPIIKFAPSEISEVPYAEPTWLAKGFFSPYFNGNHRKFQTAMRKFFVDIVYPDAQACEENGKRPSQYVLDQMACVSSRLLCERDFIISVQ